MRSNENELIMKAILSYKMLEIKITEQSFCEDSINEDACKDIKKNIFASINKVYFKRAYIKILVAAIVAISILITTVACVEPIRNYFFDIFDISINIVGNSDEIEQPKNTIQEVYLPRSILDNYTVLMEDYTKIDVTVIWETDNDYILFAQAIVDGTEISIDKVEYSDYGQKNINGVTTLYINADGLYNVVWEQYGYLFILNCPETLGWEWIEEAITSLEIVDVEIQTNN